MLRFSKREDYGIILLTELFQNYGKKLTPLSQIAKKYNIPIYFLRNIAQDLRKAKLIAALEGKNGGYKLAKNPQRIHFGKIIEALSKKPIFSCCQDTADGKCHESSCPHGFSLRRISNKFIESMYEQSLREVLKNAYRQKSSS